MSGLFLHSFCTCSIEDDVTKAITIWREAPNEKNYLQTKRGQENCKASEVFIDEVFERSAALQERNSF
jgi:hypothetical protein